MMIAADRGEVLRGPAKVSDSNGRQWTVGIDLGGNDVYRLSRKVHASSALLNQSLKLLVRIRMLTYAYGRRPIQIQCSQVRSMELPIVNPSMCTSQYTLCF